MIQTARQTLEMLVVEDNPGDVALFRAAVEATRTPLVIHVVGDGNQAMQFLRREDAFANAPRPDVVVLDLNLPLKNGHEVMAEMAADPALNGIPVAILTTSTSEAFVCDIYPPGRCLYFVKTDDFDQLQEIVRQIAAYARATRDGGGESA